MNRTRTLALAAGVVLAVSGALHLWRVRDDVRAIAQPADSNAIALRAPVSSALPEQWEERGGAISVRNVMDAAVIPFLPPASKRTDAAVLIVPGGAFRALMMSYEGTEVARWLADRGIAAFVLKHRLLPSNRDPAAYQGEMSPVIGGLADGAPLDTPAVVEEDVAGALALIRSRAHAWGIDPGKVGILGFSAGAGAALDRAAATETSSRPAFVAAIYPQLGKRQVPRGAPPLFLAIALDDPLFATGRPLAVVDSWRRAGAPIEAHLYERGGHGFGMRPTSAASALWTRELLAWLTDRGVVPPQPEPAGAER